MCSAAAASMGGRRVLLLLFSLSKQICLPKNNRED